MDRERTWVLAVAVAAVVFAVSLLGAWRAMRDPVPTMSEQDRHALYLSNLRNFAETCERPPTNPGPKDFCRKQAQLLELLSECGDDCHRRTASFTASEPSK